MGKLDRARGHRLSALAAGVCSLSESTSRGARSQDDPALCLHPGCRQGAVRPARRPMRGDLRDARYENRAGGVFGGVILGQSVAVLDGDGRVSEQELIQDFGKWGVRETVTTKTCTTFFPS